MTAEECALWVERPGALRFILQSRKFGLALSDCLELESNERAAARATSAKEAAKLIEWLRKTGRL